MDRTVIIDGIEIKEEKCDYYVNGECKCLLDCCDYRDLCMREININEDLCKDNPNCYYKQLQKAREKLERIENTCKSIKQVDNKVSIKLIEEILEDKFDIHYFLEKEEIELKGNNNEKIELGDYHNAK